MPIRLAGKSIFITGASSGIGAALANEFARRGARVALAARREERLREVQRLIEGQGGEAMALVCDVTDRASLERAIAKTQAAFGGLDIVVANAGFGVTGPFERLPTSAYRRQFETNVFGVIDTIHAALPLLKVSRGQVVIVSSLLGRLGSPGTSAYTASKFALCGLAESLHYELSELGIAVTCLEPGLIASEFRQVDNKGIHHADVPDPAPRWFVVPTDRAARSMVRAIAQKRFEAVIAGHAKVIVFCARHFPRTWRFIARRLAKGRLDAIQRRTRGPIND